MLVRAGHLTKCVIRFQLTTGISRFNGRLVNFSSSPNIEHPRTESDTRSDDHAHSHSPYHLPIKLPEPPTNCCMGGCANCVWIQYADELLRYYQEGGEVTKREIDHLLEDPTIKMFVKMEFDAKMQQEQSNQS